MEEKIIQELGIKDILKRLPHRYPFLLVDKVLIVEEGYRCIGIKNVTMNEPQFTGHFPENPIMPGVLITEAMAQTAAVLVMSEGDARKDVFFMSMDGVKFRKPVLPGDQLKMHLTLEQSRRNVYRFRGEAFVGDVLHAEGILTAMIYEKK
ncbi:MAG: 3-hydroxyacyl-ACP dehydratase FabZ [Alphaproteobacteria bacterium]|nr:3-hydroxyacyl-ACP dehydratase FabZ [Alphaproteobacteria bacterium]